MHGNYFPAETGQRAFPVPVFKRGFLRSPAGKILRFRNFRSYIIAFLHFWFFFFSQAHFTSIQPRETTTHCKCAIIDRAAPWLAWTLIIPSLQEGATEEICSIRFHRPDCFAPQGRFHRELHQAMCSSAIVFLFREELLPSASA